MRGMGLAALVLAALLGGCTFEAGPTFEPADGEALVWPAPPEKARLAWAGEYRPGERGYRRPHGLGTGSDGRLCIADPGAGVVWVHGPEGKVRHVGSGKLNTPVDCAFVGSDLLVVSDSMAGRLVAFDVRGRVAWRSAEGALARPAGLAVDTERQRIVVCDVTRHALALVDYAGAVTASLGGRGAEEGRFNFPTDVAIGPWGRLYVVDAMNFRIQVLDAEGKSRQVFGVAGDGPGTFHRPRGVAVDRLGRIYVSDALFDVIQIFDGQGRLLMALGQRGHGAGEFWMPAGVTVEEGRRLLVADAYNRRVQVFQLLAATEEQP
ncbi:MAG: hypothetical protein Q9Q40_01315 [Acidobacteriota bacterium]|nr:hypothetical protein [Acidobacteriota bacterium]